MPKILNAKQIYQAEKVTIDKFEIEPIDLMELASEFCFNWIHNRLKGNPIKIHIICGTGNNGGDGLVIARMLKKHGYETQTYVVNCDNKRTPQFLINYEKLKELGSWPIMIKCNAEFPVINENDMVIDAIFGIGLTRAPKGVLKETIQHINTSKAYVLSIDFPSGLFVDKPVIDRESVVKAFQVLTFQTAKLAFLLPENEEFCTNWDIIPIGLDAEFIDNQETDYYLTEKPDVLPLYKFRTKFAHKGVFGHALLVGGSFGKIGAVSLASKAALKIGAGLVTAYIPKSGYIPFQTALPEVMVEVDSEHELQHFNIKTNADAIGIGVGMGTTTNTTKGFTTFLKENKCKLVIDADALNILAKNKKLLDLLPKDTVLTPHPKELLRLVGKWKNDYDKIEKIQKFTKKYQFIVILKGHFSNIFYKGKIYFNTTGNPGLATPGSGDVLTGIITGLIAQGYTNFNASILGVYLHGKTADLAMSTMVYETFTASDIISNLSNAFKDLLIVEQPVINKNEEESSKK
jgi:hydroxyethylthiazole kinase-like uncharacterized protein yjeF